MRRKPSTSTRPNYSNVVWAAVALQEHFTSQATHSLPGISHLSRTDEEDGGQNTVPKKSSSSSTLLSYVTRRRRLPLTSSPAEESSPKLLHQPPRSSLAQRLGLVAGPPSLPSPEEWKEAEKKLEARGDLVRPCAICHCLLGTQPMAVLSCTHAIHVECLNRLELYIRHQHDRRGDRGRVPYVRVCPICRKQQYYARTYPRGQELYQTHCAVKIQSLWRGFMARKQYVALRRRCDASFAREWYYKKLQNLAEQYTLAVDRNARAIDTMLERLDTEKNLALLSAMTTQDWEDVRESYRHRRDNDPDEESLCPICMQNVDDRATRIKRPILSEGPSSQVSHHIATHGRRAGKAQSAHRESSDTTGAARPACILSCGHVFHADCVAIYEACVGSEGPLVNSSDEKRMLLLRCPVCRRHYTRQDL